MIQELLCEGLATQETIVKMSSLLVLMGLVDNKEKKCLSLGYKRYYKNGIYYNIT